MLAVTDTTLDLLVLQLVLHSLGVGIGALVLGILAPVEAGSEDDVLAHRGGIGGRARAILCAQAELAPGFSVGDTGVDCLGVGNVAHAAGGLYFLALVVDSVADDGLGAILVGDGLDGREFGAGLLDIIVVGPVVPILMVGLAVENQVWVRRRAHLGFVSATAAGAMVNLRFSGERRSW